jgi:hypothetical protein
LGNRRFESISLRGRVCLTSAFRGYRRKEPALEVAEHGQHEPAVLGRGVGPCVAERAWPPCGGLVKAEWFKRYRDNELPERFDRVVQSWDTADKATELSDFSVCTTGE